MVTKYRFQLESESSQSANSIEKSATVACQLLADELSNKYLINDYTDFFLGYGADEEWHSGPEEGPAQSVGDAERGPRKVWRNVHEGGEEAGRCARKTRTPHLGCG